MTVSESEKLLRMSISLGRRLRVGHRIDNREDRNTRNCRGYSGNWPNHTVPADTRSRRYTGCNTCAGHILADRHIDILPWCSIEGIKTWAGCFFSDLNCWKRWHTTHPVWHLPSSVHSSVSRHWVPVGSSWNPRGHMHLKLPRVLMHCAGAAQLPGCTKHSLTSTRKKEKKKERKKERGHLQLHLIVCRSMNLNESEIPVNSMDSKECEIGKKKAYRCTCRWPASNR